MSATLPLPLELTQPIQLTTSLEDSLKADFEVKTTKYNTETQVREDAAGVPMILNGGKSTNSGSQCNTISLGIALLDGDVVIDDNDIL